MGRLIGLTSVGVTTHKNQSHTYKQWQIGSVDRALEYQTSNCEFDSYNLILC